MEKMNHAFERVKILVGMEVDDDQNVAAPPDDGPFSFMDDFNRDCTLSTKQRFYGFAICLAAGLTCTLLGFQTLVYYSWFDSSSFEFSSSS
ncbi:hypothetical protein CK203_002301 [Vitis vinifera]|uniref:Uncharacterized protein n=1 Tax=Vitis vinifera TaxID=29760 RepID=A0A438KIN1_VITVI|nr:hypothetical protein CK203_002301 [Vitis vinifera]